MYFGCRLWFGIIHQPNIPQLHQICPCADRGLSKLPAVGFIVYGIDSLKLFRLLLVEFPLCDFRAQLVSQLSHYSFDPGYHDLRGTFHSLNIVFER